MLTESLKTAVAFLVMAELAIEHLDAQATEQTNERCSA
jgi:predicted outer membrane lipoprotein